MEEVEQKARDLGWSPKEEFRGDPEKWITAEAYVERGESLMPILKANNRKLHDEIAGLRGALTNATESIEELKKFTNKETIRAAKQEQGNLKEALVVARKEGDVDKEVEIQEKLAETTTAIKEAEKAPPSKPVNGSPEDPIFQQWKRDNPDIFENEFNSDLAVTIGTRMRRDPANKDLTGRKFLDKVAEEVNKRLEKPPGPTKVAEGGRSTGGGGSEGKKTYADLPAEAKEACEASAKRLVGPKGSGRAYTSIEDWRKDYVKKYDWS